MNYTINNFHVVIIILFLITSLIGCDDTIWIWDSKETKKTKQAKFEQERQINREFIRKSIWENIRNKVSLICLKHNISDEQFVDEMVQILAKRAMESPLSKANEPFDKNDLVSISKKFNITISTVASIIYDYELLTLNEN